MGLNVNITKNAENELESRLKNPFWGSFIIAWITWNWKIWYLTFFVTEEISGNKLEYIINMYSYFDYYSLFPFLGFILNWLIIPLALSFLVFFIVTEKIGHLFLNKKYKLEEKEIEIKNNYIGIKSDSIDRLNNLLNKEEEVIEKEKEIEVKKEKNQYQRWDDDYRDFETKKYLSSLSDLIYKYNGEIANENWEKRYNVDFEQSIDLNGLVTSDKILRDHKVYKITEKGRYFLKKYAQVDK